ncbi:MAG: hypothetical protein WAL48_25220 [Xanthobacteraceae bacterium]
MLRFSTAMIAIVTLAGVAHAAPGVATVPNYNIKAACQALSLVPEARSIDWTQSDATQHCLDAEQLAREQLVKEWSQFTTADRAMCVGVSGAGSVNPVYTELMTCLEMARDSEQSAKQSAEMR